VPHAQPKHSGFVDVVEVVMFCVVKHLLVTRRMTHCWGMGAGFSCKSFSKLNVSFKANKSAMADDKATTTTYQLRSGDIVV